MRQNLWSTYQLEGLRGKYAAGCYIRQSFTTISEAKHGSIESDLERAQDRIRDRVDEWLSGFMHKLRVGKEWGQDEKRMQVPTLTSVGGHWNS